MLKNITEKEMAVFVMLYAVGQKKQHIEMKQNWFSTCYVSVFLKKLGNANFKHIYVGFKNAVTTP